MRLLVALLIFGVSFTSCVSKKKFSGVQTELEQCNDDLARLGEEMNRMMTKLETCEQEKKDLQGSKKELMLRNEQIADLKAQINDLKAMRDKQLDQVGDLTVLSKSANENITNTLRQLESKDEYIRMIQAAKTKADSINLALAVNLKGALKDGIMDDDINVEVDKTVVFVNLSDKMLYNSGSSNLTPKANEVLGKIATVLKGRDDLEVMVEGYTDDVPISNSCMKDNWDLSVKRATSVVRLLHEKYDVDPNKLIAAGRGEYNAISSNETAEGRKANRRTRIIILPKLDQFYDLLDPTKVPKS